MIFRRSSARAAPKPVISPRIVYLQRLDAPNERPREVATNPLIYAPVYRLAFRLGALPLKVFRIRPGPGRAVREEASDHPAYLLLRRPNPQITRSYLIAGTVQDLLIHHRAVWLKVGSPPRELWPIDPRIAVPIADERNLFDGIALKTPSGDVHLPPERVCFFRLIPSPDGWHVPYSPLGALGIVGEMGFEAVDAAAELFSTGVLERRWIHSGEELSDEAFARLTARLAEARANRTMLPFLEGDLSIESMGPGPDDEAMIRGMEAARKLVYTALGVPEDDDDRRFFSNAIGPIADAIEQELERSLMSEWPQDPAFCEFQFRDLLKGTPQERAEYHRTLVQAGLETLDEARSDLDMPPLPDGAGQRAFVPLNLAEVTAPRDGKPRRRDTAGGLGGEEGKGTLPRLSASAGWGSLRKRIVSSQAEAAYRRLRGRLLGEQRQLLELLAPPARAGGTGLPSIDEVREIIARTDPELAEILRRFMLRTSELAWDAARDAVAAQAEEMAERLVEVVAERSALAVARFGEARFGTLQDLMGLVVSGEIGVRELADRIAEAYGGSLAAHLADGLARDSVGYAFEQSGILAWAGAGIDGFDVVFGGGPCTTGVCIEVAEGGPYRLGEELANVGASFAGTDTPPLHPSCTCYTVPHLQGFTV